MIRGSGFVYGASVPIAGKTAAATFLDMNTLTVLTPRRRAQRVVISNPEGEACSLDAALTAN